jgi:hypothetical protein
MYVSDFESISIRMKFASPGNFSASCGRPSNSTARYSAQGATAITQDKSG